MKQQLPYELPYRADIDGLRGIAVGAVVLYHFFPALLPSGFVGVDIFFVISGYLITSIILDGKTAGGTDIIAFYARRIRRIIPAFIVTVVAAVLFGWFFLLPHEWQSLGLETTASSLFSANLLYWSQLGYFDTESERKLLLHLWSLGVEEQFYIVWPLVLFLIPRRFLPAAIAAMTLLSFLLCLSISGSDPQAAFFLPVTRWWELSAGALISVAAPMLTRARSEHALGGISIIGLGMIVSGLFIIPAGSFPGAWAALPVLGTAAIIAAGPKTFINRTLLSGSVLRGIGLISFSLYLWHWPIRAYMAIGLGDDVPSGLKLAGIAASLLLAWLTWRFVEATTRRMDARRLAPPLLAALAALCGLGLLMTWDAVGPRMSSPLARQISTAANDDIDLSSYRLNVRESHGGEFITWAPGGGRDLLIVGDSLMAQILPRLEALKPQLEAQGQKVILASKGGCLPIPQLRYERKRKCAAFVEEAMNLAQSDAIDTVILGGRWYPHLVSAEAYAQVEGKLLPLDTVEGLDAAMADIEATIAALKAKNKTVYLVLNFPVDARQHPLSLVPACARLGICELSSATTSISFPRATSEAVTREIDLRLSEIAGRTGTTVINPHDVLCDSDQCRLWTQDGALVYRDEVHLLEEFVRAHFTLLDEILLKAAAR